ncbi:UDP-N-acetylmuramate--L-alanine ligase [Myxococcota bacterium]|nr:UDP-N-acetylmuramate--L-alanine ligase [Myxococcota bacterium]
MYRRIRRIHFVGAGGVGMSGIAELLANQNYHVTGSDLNDGPAVERLRSLGIQVSVGHSVENVGDADVVVYSSAIRASNPELREAERRNITAIPRAEMLAELMRLKEGIAVAGSHGKTTTTSLIAHVLDRAGLDPTSVIGGRVLAPSGAISGARLGSGNLLIAEADESDGSFLRLAPVIAVITNIDPEHLDHYGSFDALRDAFIAFANRIPFWGLSVLCLDHPGVQSILPEMARRTVTYGFSSQADLRAVDVEWGGTGMTFSVHKRGEELGRVQLPLPGRHNVLNCLATLTVALELEVSFEVAASAVADFMGIERRFETVGEIDGIRIVDDYGHHPAEIRATLGAARSIHSGRTLVAFQPHRFTRTRDLWEEFSSAFNDADLVFMTQIYSAGEDEIPDINAAQLVEAIRAHGHRGMSYVADLDGVLEAMADAVRPGDLVITLGAGTISTLGGRLLERLQEKRH